MKGRREGDHGLSFLYAIMQPPPVCVMVVGMRASGVCCLCFRGIVCWVVVGIVSSVCEDSAEGGAIFGYRGFCEEEDIWVVGGYEGNDVGV